MVSVGACQVRGQERLASLRVDWGDRTATVRTEGACDPNGSELYVLSIAIDSWIVCSERCVLFYPKCVADRDARKSQDAAERELFFFWGNLFWHLGYASLLSSYRVRESVDLRLCRCARLHLLALLQFWHPLLAHSVSSASQTRK